MRAVHIGFDISQTGSAKAGCGYFAHAMIQAMPELAPEHRYSLLPSFGDFYFDPLMPFRSPYPTGMQMRLAFSIATLQQPEILVMDEWLTVISS
jgi:ABC-type polysaccharide/polyol phosphate transport system ATPase subunit